MKKTYRKQVYYTIAIWLFTIQASIGQILLDDFNRADNITLGNGWMKISTGLALSSIRSNTLQIDATSNAADLVYQDVSSKYNTNLRSNTGMLTWAFNMRQPVADPNGFNSTSTTVGSNGIGFLLNFDAAINTLLGFTVISNPRGYAVVLGNSNTVTDPIRLVHIDGSIGNNALTDIIAGGDYSNEYLSVRVTYNPTGDLWSLYVESSPTEFPQTNPLLTATQIGNTVADGTYTNRNLRYLGMDWHHSTNPGLFATFDDVYIPNTDIKNYFRSAQTGNWNDLATWQMSADNLIWVAATVTPTNASNTITIRNEHVVSITAPLSFDQTVINAGGTLNRTAGSLLVADDGTALDDLIIAGTYRHNLNGPPPTGKGTIAVETGGVLEVANGINGNADFYANDVNPPFAARMNWKNGAVFYWSAINPFSTARVTYFPEVPPTIIPVFRVKGVGVSLGGSANNPTTINGVLEVETGGSLTWANGGIKTFRNGIRGGGTVAQLAGGGALQITGTSAELGGGPLNLAGNGLLIASTSLTTMSSNKQVNEQTFSVAGTLDAGSRVLSGTTAFAMNAGSSLITAHPLGVDGSNQTTGGNTFNADNSFTFNGTTAQQTGGQLLATVQSFTVNNAAGVNLTKATTVNGTLNFQNGHLTLGSSNLTVNGTINGANPSRFVVTNAAKNATTGFLTQPAAGGKWFPIGTSTSALDYTPASITASAPYQARVFNGVYENGTGANEVLDLENTVKKTWHLIPQAGTGAATVRLQWNELNEGQSFKATRLNPQTVGNLQVSGSSGSAAWAGLASQPLTGTVLGPYALTTSNSVSASSYSYYTAYTQSVPLPVTLLRFEGERRGKAVQLRWTTTAEVNAAGFEIQRTANLQGFEKIGYVAAVEQPGPVNAYAFVDEDQAQGSYYRLKQLDRNEQHVYSKPVFVAAESFLGSALALYPNPSTGQVYLSLPDASEAEMHLLSANGFRLATFVATPLEVDARLNACLQSLSAGLYVLEIHQAGRVYFNKIIRR